MKRRPYDEEIIRYKCIKDPDANMKNEIYRN